MRRPWLIICCLLVAVAVTWVRWLVIGRLSVFSDLSIWPRAIFGLCAGYLGWQYLRIQPRRSSWRHLLITACAIHVIAALALPLTSNDLFANLAFGRLADHGHNPFLSAPVMLPDGDAVRALVDPRWLRAPFAYGPVAAAIDFRVTSATSLVWSMISLKAVMLGVSLAMVGAAWLFCRRELRAPQAQLRFQWFALCPLLVWEASGQAHNDVLLAAALLGFVWAARRGRETLAVLLLCFGTLCKFVAAPVAGLYLIYVARRSPMRALVLAAIMVGGAVLGTLPFWHGSDTLFGLMTVVSPDTGRTTRSLAGLLVEMTQPLGPDIQRIAYNACWLSGLALTGTIGLIALWRARTVALVIHYSLVFLFASILVAPWMHPWYAMWLLPLALAHDDPRWLRLVARYGVLLIVEYTLPLDPVSTAAIDLYIGTQMIGLLRTRRAPSPSRSALVGTGEAPA